MVVNSPLLRLYFLEGIRGGSPWIPMILGMFLGIQSVRIWYTWNSKANEFEMDR